MKFTGGVTFALLLVAVSLPPSPLDQTDSLLISQFEFQFETRAPGNVFAFRVPSLMSARVCTQSFCYKGHATRWTLVPTKMDATGNVGLLLEGHHVFALKDFNVETSLFERNQKHYIDLRLPAQIIKDIDKSEDEIFVNREKDKTLFRLATPEPFSTHWMWPEKTVITSEFGSGRTPPGGVAYAHTGVDLHSPFGTKVRACSDGIVVDEEKDPIYGNVLTINHGQGLLSRYMHLSQFKVNVGDTVKTGDWIALSGSTGRSEAPHLHWEMRLHGQPINPVLTTLLLEHLAYLE